MSAAQAEAGANGAVEDDGGVDLGILDAAAASGDNANVELPPPPPIPSTRNATRHDVQEFIYYEYKIIYCK